MKFSIPTLISLDNEEVKIALPNGKTLVIEAHGAGSSSYISKASTGGNPLTKSWLSHEELLCGETIRFDMVPDPDKNLWSSPGSYPASVSTRVN